MSKRKGSGIYTGVVTLALAGVLGLGAYKWDNIKPAILETKIYTQEDMDNQIKNESQESGECCAVTFVGNQGVLLESQVVASGDTAANFTGETPTKEHHRFIGWSIDGENLVDISQISIRKNITFNAVFEHLTLDNTSFDELLERGYLKITDTGTVNTQSSFSKLGAGTLTIEGHPEITTAGRFLDGSNIITKVDLSKSSITTIHNGSFNNNAVLTEIKLPSALKTISSSAFSGCSSLSQISLPEGLETIMNNAFTYCSSLTNIKIPSTVTSLGFGAFKGCSNLKSLWIPKSVLTINSSGYYGICQGITDFMGFYVESEESLEGWESKWNLIDSEQYASINYGYTYEQYLEAIGE